MILDILNSIAAKGSTNQKLEILTSHADNELLKRVYRLAYHPQIQFGIKKIPDYDKSPKVVHIALEDSGILDFLETDLAKRILTGNTAINALTEKLSALEPKSAEVVERIIKRDLACGASSTMANKVWKNIIPKQPQMLATSFSEKALAKIKFPAYAQLKADGARCFAEIRGFEREDVKLLSRAGNEYQNINALKDELITLYKKVASIYPEGITVDGELVYVDGDTANRQTSNGIANKALKGTITDAEAVNMSFQVWDLYSLDTAYGGKKSKPYQDRFAELSSLAMSLDKLIVIENTIVNNIAEARAIYKNYVLQGLEGIILKNMLSLWEDKRSANQIKFKEEINVDLRIVGFTPHTKDPSKIGSFELESECGRIKVNSGSGLTDTDAIKTNKVDEFGEAIWETIPVEERSELNRARLMHVWDEIKGTIIETKCNGFTTSDGRKDSVSLFLPIILKLRADKTTANTFAEMFPDADIVFEDN